MGFFFYEMKIKVMIIILKLIYRLKTDKGSEKCTKIYLIIIV